MFDFLRKSDTSSIHESAHHVDELSDYVEEKKRKLQEDHTVEEIFYIHEQPKPFRRTDMPMDVLEREAADTGTIQVLDQRTGKMVAATADQLKQRMEKIPDGLNVPGLGAFGPNQQGQVPRQRPQQAPQQAPQQMPQQAPQQAMPQQQMVPQQPMQQQQPMAPQQPMMHPQQQVPQQMTQRYPMQYPQQIPVQSNQPLGQPLYPSHEIIMIEGAYHLFIDLPGVQKEDLKLAFNAGTLSISGTRESAVDILVRKLKKPRGKKELVKQHNATVPPHLMGTFQFSYPFQKMVDSSAIEAQFDNGVLHVTMPHLEKGDDVSIPIM